MTMKTICTECNGDSAENLVGNPIQCEACQDTGRLHVECDRCGAFHDLEEYCPDCEEAGLRAEMAYDAWVDAKIDERREECPRRA
jgi:DnaJ-class molecular chaperone